MWRFTRKVQCRCIRLPVSLGGTHLASSVHSKFMAILSLSNRCRARFQTSQLPKDDRYSVSLKEYLAEIDVCMGGRVAEGLGACYHGCRHTFTSPTADGSSFAVYGPENVTSGASSDLQHATRTARAMVKVRTNPTSRRQCGALIFFLSRRRRTGGTPTKSAQSS